MKTYFASKGKISGYIYDLDALKQSINHILETAVSEHIIYSFNFGNGLLNVDANSKDELKAKSQNYIKQALLYDDRISDVHSFSFESEGDCLFITFLVDTIWGTITSEVSI